MQTSQLHQTYHQHSLQQPQTHAQQPAEPPIINKLFADMLLCYLVGCS
jgi:hypothetical protein